VKYPKTLVIIPALNEEESIAHVLELMHEYVPWADVAVINDGSVDRTAALAQECGAIVLSEPHNVGIGAAVQTGFIYAARYGYEVTVQNDGDGQHDPREIPRLVSDLVESGADLVVGSRYIEDRGYITPRSRRTGIILLAHVISLIIRQSVTDPTSGFRASSRRTIQLCAHLYPHDYPEPEALVMLHRAGLKLREIPVTMNPRYGGKSSITPIKSGLYMVKVLLAILIDVLRSAPKLDDID
jgi:glycosyltransferase involved in cell wall biosynthesis